MNGESWGKIGHTVTTLKLCAASCLLFGIVFSHLYPATSLQGGETSFFGITSSEILERLARTEARLDSALSRQQEVVAGNEVARIAMAALISRQERMEATLEWLVWLTTGGGFTIGLMGLERLTAVIQSFKKD
jgi:hypothetical protein